MKAPCPVCYADMLTWSDYLDGHTLMESGEECPHGCFLHRDAYGNTEITVNIRGHHFMFGHCYLDGFEASQEEWAAVEALFVPARAALIEDLRMKTRSHE
jgi:hypothetical protein